MKKVKKLVVIGVIILFLGLVSIPSLSANVSIKLTNSNLNLIDAILTNNNNDPYWMVAEVVSIDSYSGSDESSLVAEPDGTVHVISIDGNHIGDYDTVWEMYYRTKTADDTWSETECLSEELGIRSWSPKLSLGPDGTLHLVFLRYNEDSGGTISDLYYRTKPCDGSWTETELLSINSDNNCWSTSLAVDSNGIVHVVWSEEVEYDEFEFYNEIFYSARSNDGSWGTVKVISSEKMGHSSNPTIAIEPDETVHVVWSETTDDLSKILYKKGLNDGSWEPIEEIISDDTGYYEDPSIAVDSDETVHVVWSGDKILYCKKSNNGNWETIKIVSTESTGHCTEPYTAVDQSGTIHIVYSDDSEYSASGADKDIFYKTKSRDGKWTATEIVSIESTKFSECPSLAVDQSGTIHVIWNDYTDYNGCGGDLDVFYKKKTECDNQPPETPIITADDDALNGVAGEEYTYIFTSTDPDEDKIYYYVDWDWRIDGNEIPSNWIGPYESGAELHLKHSWDEAGTYFINAKTKDIYGEESEWADPFRITMPRNKALNPIFIQLLEKFPILSNLLKYLQ